MRGRRKKETLRVLYVVWNGRCRCRIGVSSVWEYAGCGVGRLFFFCRKFLQLLGFYYRSKDVEEINGHFLMFSQRPRCKHTGHQICNDASIGVFDPRGSGENGLPVDSLWLRLLGSLLRGNKMLDTLDEPLSEDLIKRFHYELSGVFEDLANGL